MVPSVAKVDNLISMIACVSGSMTSKDELVVNLTPLPRYQGSCCVVTTHGLQGDETPGTLNTLLRDILIYLRNYLLLQEVDHI